MRTVGLLISDKIQTKARSLTCVICGREYKTASALQKHIKDKHGENKKTTDRSKV